ncbi:MAG: hypothetical protein ACI9S8_000307 [Chlamydiales bacterium]|jgi:signal transduction histidine kinase
MGKGEVIVSSEIQTEKQGLNLFGQSPSLCFQFILAEFIETYKEVQTIENIYKEMESLLIKRRLLADVDHLLRELLDCIIKLSGSAIINEDSFSWISRKGCLSKLRQYCYPFVNLLDNKESTIVNLNICVSKAFHSALQAREVILYLRQEDQSAKKMPDYAMLYQLLDRLVDNINRASRLILRVIIRFREDENVVYFLLRNKDQLDAIYKTNFVTKLFRKMYPDGVEEAGQLLMRKYSERGFTKLLNTIAGKIAHVGNPS